MISKTCTMPVDVFLGAGGDIVLCQEWPDLKGENYIRVFIDPDDAEKVCQQIMSWASAAKVRP